MKNGKDKMLLEGLVKKYGKNGVKAAMMKMNESLEDMNIEVSIEFYTKRGRFYAWVGEENYSGNECSGNTVEEMLDEVKDYLYDRINNYENDEYDEE